MIEFEFYAYETVGFTPINIPNIDEIFRAAGISQEMQSQIKNIEADAKEVIISVASERLMASISDVTAVLDNWLNEKS